MPAMLFLLSPAKTLDFDTPVRAPLLKKATEPLFADRAAELIGVLDFGNTLTPGATGVGNVLFA